MESDKEIFFKVNMIEQYMKNIQQQVEIIENEILELNSLKEGLKGLEGCSGKEIFSSLGKGIFIKAKISSEELLVKIGGKDLIKKSIPETEEIIKKQMSKLEFARRELSLEMEKLNEEAEKIMSSIEKRN